MNEQPLFTIKIKKLPNSVIIFMNDIIMVYPLRRRNTLIIFRLPILARRRLFFVILILAEIICLSEFNQWWSIEIFCGGQQKWIPPALNKDQRVQAFLFLQDYLQEIWLKVCLLTKISWSSMWLLVVLGIKMTITFFLVSWFKKKKVLMQLSFSFFKGLKK